MVTSPDLERIADFLLDPRGNCISLRPRQPHLQMYTRDLDYYSNVPTATEAQRIADEAANLCGIDGSAWLAECARLRESGLASQRQTGSVHFFYLNDGCFCGLPEEIFCEIALQASSRVPAPYFFPQRLHRRLHGLPSSPPRMAQGRL